MVTNSDESVGLSKLRQIAMGHSIKALGLSDHDADEVAQTFLEGLQRAGQTRGGPLAYWRTGVANPGGFLATSLRHCARRLSKRRANSQRAEARYAGSRATPISKHSTRRTDLAMSVVLERARAKLRRSDARGAAEALLVLEGLSRDFSVEEMSAAFGIAKRTMYHVLERGLERLAQAILDAAETMEQGELPSWLHARLMKPLNDPDERRPGHEITVDDSLRKGGAPNTQRSSSDESEFKA